MNDMAQFNRVTKRLADAELKITQLQRQVSSLQSKAAVQRNELARLTQLSERLVKERGDLLSDIKWLRGEVA
jgi:peptidoglycan hydrolase CwlO-like protein